MAGRGRSDEDYAFLARYGAPPDHDAVPDEPGSGPEPAPPVPREGSRRARRDVPPAATAAVPEVVEDDERVRRTWPQRILLGLGVLSVMACLAVVVFVGYQAARIGGIARKDVAVNDAADNEAQ